jgi:hypothetical protein
MEHAGQDAGQGKVNEKKTLVPKEKLQFGR